VDIQNWNLRHFALLATVAVTFASLPSRLEKTRLISIQKTLNIQTSKIDPPRLAFDEVHSDEQKVWTDWNLLQKKEGTHLVVGDEANRFASQSPTQSLRTRKIVLQAMTFTRAEIERNVADSAWVEDLPAAEQKRLTVAQAKYGTLDEDWNLPTFREMAAKKIEEAKKQIAESVKPARVIVQAVQPDGSKQTPDSVHTADVQVRNNTSPVYRGVVEIKGLPSGQPQWEMRIARYEDDIKKEDGRIDARTSTFEIPVAQSSGVLVAEMVDSHTGEVLGEGRVRLSDLKGESKQNKMTIAAVNNQMLASFASFYSDPSLNPKIAAGRNRPVATRVLLASLEAEGQTDKSGLYSFDQIQKGSWGLLRTEAKGFKSGLYMLQSGQEKRLPLFPESMIQAMKQIIRDQSNRSEVAETGSVVWGQVLQNGKPVAGAEVEVEAYENYRPVYFNNLLIPDVQLKATSENGFFAFVHLPAGYHSLVASQGLAYISHVNVVVDDDTVSIAQLESSLQTEKASVKVFDAFSGQPAVAQLEMQSLSAALDVRGFAEVNLSPIQRLSFMKVHPQSQIYSDALQIYEDTADSIYAPLIRNDWLQALLASRKINQQPDTGVVVGFVGSGNFETYLGHEPRFPVDQIVYFDSRGSIVDKGVPGGGFVLFNVPLGVQSIVIAHPKSDQLQTQVIPMDESSLVVLKFR
jgi:hypothetical protein